MPQADVVVVGAGPAGTVLAARLARLGHRVVLVERARFPRAHVGEALSPAVWPLLDTAGLSGGFADAVVARFAGTRLCWSSPEVEEVETRDGVLVDRARLDAWLLAEAHRSGVCTVRATARAPRRTPAGWSVPTSEGAVDARVVVDATGRRRVLGGRRIRTASPTLALSGCWAAPVADGCRMLVEAFDDGWWWAAEEPDGIRAMVFVDPATVAAGRRRGAGPAVLYGELLERTLLLRARLRGVERIGPAQVLDATPYRSPDPIAPDVVAVGEAAFAVDALSSSGVLLAVQTAVAGAAVVNTLLRGPEAGHVAVEYQRTLVDRLVAHHAATAVEHYAQSRWAGAPFWADRARGRVTTPPPAPTRTPVPDPEAPVRLATGASLVELPCLVGDIVERRVAVRHPSLPHPVAFLGDVDLGPVLALLRTTPSSRQLVATIGAWLGHPRAAAVVGWFRRNGLTEEVVPEHVN